MGDPVEQAPTKPPTCHASPVNLTSSVEPRSTVRRFAWNWISLEDTAGVVACRLLADVDRLPIPTPSASKLWTPTGGSHALLIHIQSKRRQLIVFGCLS